MDYDIGIVRRRRIISADECFFAAPAAAPSGFQGIGDVVPSAQAFWGLRAYNAAYATGTNPCVDLLDQAEANPITINILTTGLLDIASINTWVAAHGVTTIRIAKLYDQIGTKHASGATAHYPALVLTPYPHMFFAASIATYLQVLTFTVAQPFTSASIGNRADHTTGSNMTPIQNGNTGASIVYGHITGGSDVSGWGVATDTPVFNNSVIRVQSASISGAGNAKVRANQTLVTTGTSTAVFSADPLDIYCNGPDGMEFYELAIWSGDKSSQFAVMNANQQAVGGGSRFDAQGDLFDMTISNGGLTAANNTGAVDAGALAGSPSGSGKEYCEATATVMTSANATQRVGLGICNYNGTGGAKVGAGGGTAGYLNDGTVLVGNVSQTALASYTQGDIIGMATDFDANKLWFRKNGGGWNNDILANQNPATGTGGYDISGLTHPTVLQAQWVCVTTYNLNDAWTINCGQSAYANAAPSGFINW